MPFNTLTCVNRFNARRPLDVYRFLRNEVGSTYMQFIPIVEYKGFEKTAPHKWNNDALPTDGDPEARPGHPEFHRDRLVGGSRTTGAISCARSLIEWRRNDVGKVLVNHFETLVSQHLGLGSQLCIYGEFCGKGVAVEHDGSVYSCDHYVYPEYRLGNVKDAPLDRRCSPASRSNSATPRTRPCRSIAGNARISRDCWGECPKNRIIRTADGEPGLNYLCRGLKQFFAHAIPEVDRIAAQLRKQPLHPRPRM